MSDTTLATFRIDKKTWEEFKQLASERGSNASSELNQFILRSLGRIDNSLDTIKTTNLESYIDNRLDDIDNRLDTLGYRLDSQINGVLDRLGKLEEIAFTNNNSIDNCIDKNIDSNHSYENALEDTLKDNQVESSLKDTEAVIEAISEEIPDTPLGDNLETTDTQEHKVDGLTDKELAEKLTAMGRNTTFSTANRWRHGKSNPTGKNKNLFNEWEVKGDRWFKKI